MKQPRDIISNRIDLNVATIISDACGHEIAADDILRDLDDAGYEIVERHPAAQPAVRLSPAQRRVLEHIRDARPTGGNDEGWIQALDTFPRPTVKALQRMGMIEPRSPGYIGQTSGQYHRITAAGRAAVFRL